MEQGLIIINKSGFLGSRKPCTNCGNKDCKKKGTQNNGEDDDDEDLEPLYPAGISEEDEEEQEADENALEPMLPASARSVKY